MAETHLIKGEMGNPFETFQLFFKLIEFNNLVVLDYLHKLYQLQ